MMLKLISNRWFAIVPASIAIGIIAWIWVYDDPYIAKMFIVMNVGICVMSLLLIRFVTGKWK